MKFLVTGCVGFIGFHIARKLIRDGHKVIGIDNINSYYDLKLKKDRLNTLKALMQKNLFFTNLIFLRKAHLIKYQNIK